MRWQVEETVGEFGRHLGIEDLKLDDAGSIVLEIDRIGRLGIEMVGERDDRVAVSLSRDYREPFPEEASRFALENCHYRSRTEFVIQPAFSGGGRLAFAVCLDTSDLTVPSIHQIVDELDRFHESMNQVAPLAS